jgi:hypothetical protein
MKQLGMKRSFAKPFAEQHPMKLNRPCLGMLPALALTASILFASASMHAQSPAGDNPAAQQPGAAPDQTSHQNTQHTFTGVIAKHGDRLLLTDPLTRTSYQLDDQRRAEELVDKNVKVTGSLDPSTGTIRVSAIDPL